MHIKDIRILQGSLYGYKQKIALCFVEATLLFPIDLHPLHTYMEEIFELKLDKEYGSVQTLEALLDALFYYSKTFHNLSKLGIYEKITLLEKSLHANTYTMRLAVPYDFNAKASLDCFYWTLEVFTHVFMGQGQHVDPKNLYKKHFNDLIKRHHSNVHIGINQVRFLEAAFDLNIRTFHLVGSIYIFGYGKNSRYLESSYTDSTNILGADIAKFKNKTHTVLKKFGLPVPKQLLIQNEKDIVTLLGQIPFPVVIKPMDAEAGFGVYAGLTTYKSVCDAYNEALKISKNIALEEYIYGDDYRLTVLHNRVIKVIKRLAGGVVGDGIHTIESLVAKAQSDLTMKERSRVRGYCLLTLDAEALGLLEEFGKSPQTIPQSGEYIQLRRKSNISAGGTNHTVNLADVHTDNLQLAIEATKALRLDIAGVDFICRDISKSWLEVGGGICEINAQPQIGYHSTPTIYQELLKELVPNRGKIPMVLSIGKTFNSPKQLSYKTLALVNAQGVFLNNKKIVPYKDLFSASYVALNNTESEFVHIVVDAKERFENGLPFDRCDILYSDCFETIKDVISKIHLNCHYIILDEIPKEIDPELKKKCFSSTNTDRILTILS